MFKCELALFWVSQVSSCRLHHMPDLNMLMFGPQFKIEFTTLETWKRPQSGWGQTRSSSVEVGANSSWGETRGHPLHYRHLSWHSINTWLTPGWESVESWLIFYRSVCQLSTHCMLLFGHWSSVYQVLIADWSYLMKISRAQLWIGRASFLETRIWLRMAGTDYAREDISRKINLPAFFPPHSSLHSLFVKYLKNKPWKTHDINIYSSLI